MKKNIRRIVSIMLTLAMIASMMSVVFAIENLVPDSDIQVTGIKSTSNNILRYVQVFGYAMAIGMIIYLGIKYVMSSANEKADLKKGSINYVIGAIIVAAASTILGIIIDIGDDVL